MRECIDVIEAKNNNQKEWGTNNKFSEMRNYVVRKMLVHLGSKCELNETRDTQTERKKNLNLDKHCYL